VQYVQVNVWQAWKIAAFSVAFFSSFFAFSFKVDYSKLDGVSPKVDTQCVVTSTTNGTNAFLGSTCDVDVANLCMSLYPEQEKFSTNDYRTNPSGHLFEQTETFAKVQCTWTRNFVVTGVGWTSAESGIYLGNVGLGKVDSNSCPPESHPNHSFGLDTNEDGETDICYHPNDIAYEQEKENELKKNDDYCKELVIDSGNNTASTMCYNAYNGASCSVSKQTTGDASYYSGTGNNALGCGNSEDPTYDSSGTGTDKDSCIHSNGKNYCEAKRDKHCSSTSGTEICDDGCIDNGSTLMCDTSLHNDVGEGESNYHDDNGTCSVIAASSSRGFCEDMGGDWDEAQDYQETSCPVGTGTCSVPTAGHCAACFDAGGSWTPDDVTTQSQETKASIEVAALVKKSNEKLAQIEAGVRSTMETQVSTIKSGNQKVVAAIEELSKLTKDSSREVVYAIEKEEEKETFSTTTGDIDKSKINALFDESSKAALQAEITQLQTDMTSFINLAKAEATSLMTINVPSGSGYEARNLVLTQGSFDLSLSRFGFFFNLLSGAVMLLCSISAGFILLGKD